MTSRPLLSYPARAPVFCLKELVAGPHGPGSESSSIFLNTLHSALFLQGTQKQSTELKSFNLNSCRSTLSGLCCSGWETAKTYCGVSALGGELGTYGLRGGFGFCRLHVQMGHHGLQTLFVFCKLVGRKCCYFFEYRCITILTSERIHIPN